MKNWFVLLFAGWATVTVGLFLATIAGEIAEEPFAITGDGRQIIQAAVMSLIVVPIILYLYQRLNKLTGKSAQPVYSLKRAHHLFTGFFLAVALAVIGLFISSALGWVQIEQWHAPQYWIGALLLNMLIAFFYEALPEELALRGLVYDALRHRFAVWLSILAQTLVFVAFGLGITFLQAFVGIGTIDLIFMISHSMILFVFGIGLALIRLYTGSLWAAIGFHLGYLAMARFFVMPTEYGAPPIVTFQEMTMYGEGAALIINGIFYGSIFILLILLIMKRFRKRK